MKLSWKQQKRTKGLVHVPADNEKNNVGLMTGVEKGFFEVLLFTFSVVLHLSHSLGGEHDNRL